MIELTLDEHLEYLVDSWDNFRTYYSISKLILDEDQYPDKLSNDDWMKQYEIWLAQGCPAYNKDIIDEYKDRIGGFSL